METRKIALACLIGGLICSAVALLVAPAIWWLGMLAGFAGGYVSYEFREVRRAIPIALRQAGGVSWGVVSELLKELRAFLLKPHPFGYLAILVCAAFTGWLITHASPSSNFGNALARDFVRDPAQPIVIFGLFAGCLFFLPIIMVSMLTFMMIAQMGLDKDVRNWTDKPEKVKTFEEGDRIVLLNYSDAFRWLARGLGEITLFFVWYAWKYSAIGIWKAGAFLCRFAWHLFKIIHSEKRLLCGVDGAIGGAVSYLWFSSLGNPLAVVLFGGLLGAALGILNWEVVSKRILKVQVQK